MTTEVPTQELVKADLPEPVARRGINEAQWRTLANNLFPGAHPQSVLMVIDYCQARKLDPLKKPCHIVPMRVKDARTNEWGWRDVVMPGIYEYRTTAQRTGQYLGRSRFEYGPTIEYLGVKAPEWCETTIYRAHGEQKIEFPIRRYFVEVVGTTEKNNVLKVNDRWSRAPIQMLEKCTEAAGLREAFPDEFGGEQTAEEMEHQIVELEPVLQVRPAERKSQQVPTPSASSAQPTGAAAPLAPSVPNGGDSGHVAPPAVQAAPATAAPSPIGVIAQATVATNGTLVVLDNGYRAAVKAGDEATNRAVEMARDGQLRVELVVKVPRDPTKFLPVIIGVQPAEAQA